MKNALGTAIQNAVVILVTVTMRLGVLDNHMMVGQLVAARQVQAVQNALDPLAGQGGANIISR